MNVSRFEIIDSRSYSLQMRSTTPEKRMKEIRTLLGDIDTYVKG
jgi:hypothetical protein